MSANAKPQPYFSNINFNSALFTQSNLSITLQYALDTFLKRIGTATSIATSTSFSGTINCTNNTASTSPLTGAITIAGGLGVNGSINCNGITTTNITSNISDVTTIRGRILQTFPLSAESVSLGGYNLSTTGTGNTAIGFNSLFANTTGSNNSGCGMSTIQNNTTGVENTAVGYHSLLANTTGSNNTAIGHYAGLSHVNKLRCTFLGSNTSSSSNAWTNSTAIGFGATITGSNQIVLGTASENTLIAGNLTCLNQVGIPSSTLSIGAPTTPHAGVFLNVHSITDTPQSQGTVAIGNCNSIGAALRLGYQGISDYATIDSIQLGTIVPKRIFINSQGGNVGIGNLGGFSAPQQLTVAGNIQCSGNYMISGSQISTSNLSDVSNGTFLITFTMNGGGGTTSDKEFTWTKTRNVVTLQIPDITITSGTGSNLLSSDAAIPAAIRPLLENSFVSGRNMNNGSMGGDNFPCMITMLLNGNINIQRGGAATNYANSAGAGLGSRTSITYLCV